MTESLHVIDLNLLIFTVRGLYISVTLLYTPLSAEMNNIKQTSQAISNTAIGHVRINK